LGTVRKALTEVALLQSVRFRRLLGNWTIGRDAASAKGRKNVMNTSQKYVFVVV